MDLTYDDVQQILKIIDNAPHLDEIELVYNGFRLHVVRNGAAGRPQVVSSSPVQPRAPAAERSAAPLQAQGPAARTPSAAKPVPDGVIVVRAPMLGTYYRAPSPTEKPFVEIGQKVKANDTVCLIEVMKLFNSIHAGVDGEVIDILVENEALVEFNQPLIFIAPAAKV